MKNMRYSLSCGLCAALAAAACQAPAKSDAVAATRATTAAAVSVPNDGLIPGTPEGDLGDWVKDIRRGIRTLPAMAATDAGKAQRTAIELYVTRQEYDEMYYGKQGRLHASPELAQAIATAEERFHELMKLLGTSKPTPEAVKSAVSALDAQQAHVAELWRKSDIRINRAGK